MRQHGILRVCPCRRNPDTYSSMIGTVFNDQMLFYRCPSAMVPEEYRLPLNATRVTAAKQLQELYGERLKQVLATNDVKANPFHISRALQQWDPPVYVHANVVDHWLRAYRRRAASGSGDAQMGAMVDADVAGIGQIDALPEELEQQPDLEVYLPVEQEGGDDGTSQDRSEGGSVVSSASSDDIAAEDRLDVGSGCMDCTDVASDVSHQFDVDFEDSDAASG